MNDEIILLTDLLQTEIIIYGVEISEGLLYDANKQQRPCR